MSHNQKINKIIDMQKRNKENQEQNKKINIDKNLFSNLQFKTNKNQKRV